MKNSFNTVLSIILIFIILLLSWRIGNIKNENQNLVDDLKKSIIMNDSLVKEAEGRYSKLVNYYNTEKDLKEQLKESNKDLYNIVKKSNEKILSLTNVVITLQGQVNSGFGKIDKLDSNKIDLTLKYPNDNNPYINWKGSINRKTAYYNGEWSFGKLPLQIVLTEEQKGLWKSRLIGPEWLKVDSMIVNSLPNKDYCDNQLKKLQFLVGAGYIKSLTNQSDAISVGTGVSFNGKHNILLKATTNKEVGISYYYNFQKKKTNK
jgi:hypothetical protein